MTNRGAEVNQQAAQPRAESYWLVYQALGPGRSLSKLHRVLADLGLDVSVNTLKGWPVGNRLALEIECILRAPAVRTSGRLWRSQITIPRETVAHQLALMHSGS